MPRVVKNKQIILMQEEMIQTLYQEKDGQRVLGSILNCSEPGGGRLPSQETSREEEEKEHVIRQLRLN